MDLKIVAPQNVDCVVNMPASKSVSNRALIISALGGTMQVNNLATCDDTQVLIDALWVTRGTVNVGAAGTAMRFLTAYFACCDDVDVILDGCDRMRERPIEPLVTALRLLGADIDYCGTEGFPPLRVRGKRLHPGTVVMRSDVSSQFVSALMMIGPEIGGLTIELEGNVVSRPYIDLTAAVMAEQGASVIMRGNTIEVAADPYRTQPITVGGDWSAAAWWMALKAVMPTATVALTGLHPNSAQGDKSAVRLFENLGVGASWQGDTLHLGDTFWCACSSFADLNSTPDLIQPFVMAHCLTDKQFRITGVSTLRIKETDRVEALRSELLKLGYVLQVESDALIWRGEKVAPATEPVFDSHGDHRMAMTLALAAVKMSAIVITNAQVVTKSYPGFWQQLANVGFKITEL